VGFRAEMERMSVHPTLVPCVLLIVYMGFGAHGILLFFGNLFLRISRVRMHICMCVDISIISFQGEVGSERFCIAIYLSSMISCISVFSSLLEIVLVWVPRRALQERRGLGSEGEEEERRIFVGWIYLPMPSLAR